MHAIHNHPETTADASTKAKLKVEPLNSLDSSLSLSLSSSPALFLSVVQIVLVLKSSIFF